MVIVTVLYKCTIIYILCSSRGIEVPTTYPDVIFLHGLGRLIRSGIDALPSFPGASTISSHSRFVVEGVFQKSGEVHTFEMVDPVLFGFGFNVLYCRYLRFFYYDLATYFVQSCVSFNTS
jgi:hypothetical protein